MKNIKSLFLLVMLALIVFNSIAQEFDENEFRFYSGISAGYGFGILKTKVGELNSIDFDCISSMEELAANPLIVTDVLGSYGEGWNDAFYIGYRLTKIFGAELSLNYSEGRKFRNNNLFDGITTKRNYVETRLYVLSLKPRLLIHFYHHNRWNLYAMAGPRLAVWNQYQAVWALKEHCNAPDSLYKYES